MIVLSGALVLVALVLLVFGALDRNLPYVYASIGVSLLSLLLLLVGILQRRGELDGDDQDETTAVTDTTDERVPALVGAGQEQDRPEGAEVTAELAVPAGAQDRPASRRVAPAGPADDEVQQAPAAERDVEPEEEVPAEGTGEPDDEDVVDEDVEDEDVEDEDVEGSGVTVLVVSGRPRYHLEGCRVLRGKEPQALDRDDARTHGFSPCGVCKPDADETAAAAATEQDGESFAETIFGGPLFTDAPAEDADRVDTSALPDRPVQPVLLEVEPAPADETVLEASDEADTGLRGADDAPVLQGDEPVLPADDDAPADGAPALQGDDPADDPSVVPAPAVEPAPDVAGDPDELPAALAETDAGSRAVDDEDSTAEPVVEPVLPQEVPVRGDAGAEGLPPAARARRTQSTTAAPEQEPEPDVVPPAQAAPVKASSRRGSGTRTSGTEAPAKAKHGTSAPAQKGPAKKTPAKKAPVKKAPAKKVAAAEATPVPEEPQVKRPVVRAVRADALRLGAPSTGVTTTRVSARAAAPVSSASVVVVPERERFHRPECRFVRGVAGATTLPKASATRQGYVPCGVCKP